MSHRFTKKVRQFYRRDLKAKVIKDMNFLAVVLKKRPKLVPMFAWHWIVGITVDREKLIEIINKNYAKN